MLPLCKILARWMWIYADLCFFKLGSIISNCSLGESGGGKEEGNWGLSLSVS